ncbi:hypothetical protein VTN77DRAFT_8863 [Rasamsonia byssochlamydoides]|uniref:uncharacterized protein n=1 Tax=Rasamsonia byssochlamydoides TaxID=89139 RepID=UPI0037440311
MSQSSTSSGNLHAKDTCKAAEAAEDVSTSSPLPLPTLGPPSSACDVLQPLSHLSSQWSVPVPTSGLVASLARQKSQQVASHSLMQDDGLQSESGTNRMKHSAGIQEPEAPAPWRASDHPQIQSSSEVELPFKRISSCSDCGLHDSQSFPTQDSSVFPEGVDQCTVFSRRYDNKENLDRESVWKRSERVQLFRGKDENSDKIWSRRVIEYH